MVEFVQHPQNQHPQDAKFRAKLKILNFGTKNAWFKCFYAANLMKNYSDI